MANKVGVIITGSNQSSAAIKSVQSDLGGLSAMAGKLGKALEALAIIETVKKLSELVMHTVEAAADMGHMSERTGIAVEELSALSAAAQLSGVNAESFEKGMRKLSKTLSDAAAGSEQARATLKALGMSATDAQGKTWSLTDALLKIADKMAAAKNGADKAAVAMQAFGKTGDTLIPFLNQGSEGIEKLIEQLKALGIPLSKEDAEAAEQFERQMKLLDMAGQALVRNIVMGMIPALMNVVTAINESSGATNGFRVVGEAIGVVIKSLATVFVALGLSIAWAGSKLKTLAEAMSANNWEDTKTKLKQLFGVEEDSYSTAIGQNWDKAMEALWGDHPLPKLPDLSGGGKDIKRQNAEADALAKQRLQNEIAIAKLGAEYRKSMDDQELEQLEEMNKRGLISVQDFFDRKRQLQEDTLQASISAMQAELEAEEAYSKKAPEKERLASLAKINQLTEQLSVAQTQLNRLQGKTAAGDAEDPIARQIRDMQMAEAEAERLQQKIDAVFSELEIRSQRVSDLVSSHQISEADGEKLLNQYRAEAAEKVGGMATAYEQLATASGNPQLVANAKRLKSSVDELGDRLNWVKDTAVSDAQNAFTNLFQSIITDAPNASAAFVNFGKAVMDAIAGIIAKMWAMWAVQKLLGWLMPKSSVNGVDISSSRSIPLASSSFDGMIPELAGGGSLGAGQLALVGEVGPELFVPNQAGTVVAHNQLGAMSGTTVNLSIDNRGADLAAVQRLEQQLPRLKNEAAMLAVAVVEERARRH